MILDNLYVIVRTATAGCFAGTLTHHREKEVILNGARRLWYWTGAATLSQLAVDGTSNPGKCKFPVEVPSILLTDVIEIIECTDKARSSINEVKPWSM